MKKMKNTLLIVCSLLFTTITLLSCGGKGKKADKTIINSSKTIITSGAATTYSSKSRKPICGCYLVCKMKGNERVSSWYEFACDDRGYEYIGYPNKVIEDKYSNVFKGTEYKVTTSKVSDNYCE